MKFKKLLFICSILPLNFVFASGGDYNFCGYKTKLVDPETSSQFKNLGMTDQYTVTPSPVKFQGSKKSLDEIILGSGKTLKEYRIYPYNLTNAKDNYIKLPDMGPFMLVWAKEYKKYIPAAWVYWLGDGKTAIDGHYQPYNRVLEPINFIFVIKGFDDKSKANNYIVAELKKAGFTKEHSDQHSSGYAGIFKSSDGKLKILKQISGVVNGAEHGYTFEDVDNPDKGGNHFRLFGPYQDQQNNTYIYTASLSKESPRYYKDSKRCGHMYESFTSAKSILALGLLDKTNTEIYSTNLFTSIPDQIVKKYANSNTYFTGDQQITNNQISNVAFVAVINKK